MCMCNEGRCSGTAEVLLVKYGGNIIKCNKLRSVFIKNGSFYFKTVHIISTVQFLRLVVTDFVEISQTGFTFYLSVCFI